MDELMGDDAKDPGPFQQRGAPAAEPGNSVAESMDEAMDYDTTTATTPPLIPEHPDQPTGAS